MRLRDELEASIGLVVSDGAAGDSLGVRGRELGSRCLWR
jgi:hypothetical protein